MPGAAARSAPRSSSTRLRVLGHQSKPRRGVAPHRAEIRLDRPKSLLAQRIDAARALAPLLDESGILQEPEVERDRRTADWELVCELADRPRSLRQKPEDRAALGVAEGLE